MPHPRFPDTYRITFLAAAILFRPATAAPKPEAPTAAKTAMHAAAAPTMGTWFDGLGQPYGGCGVPQELLETQDFVALNVYDTPGEYALSPARPLTGADLPVMGEFANGANCGRWVEVTVGPICKGTNDGAPGQPFCRGDGAQWADDAFSGASLNMLVADACGDGNAWCRDSRKHLDLSKPSLGRFLKAGQPAGDMAPDHWNNRQISWRYIPSPDYQGDIRIYFLKGTQKYWTAISITHLPNGIHTVEQKVNGAWVRAKRYVDMGQGFLLETVPDDFRIRILDASDAPLQGGREYVFAHPESCGGTCDAAATPAPYTAFASDGTAVLIRASTKTPGHAAATLQSGENGVRFRYAAPLAGDGEDRLLDAQGRRLPRFE